VLFRRLFDVRESLSNDFPVETAHRLAQRLWFEQPAHFEVIAQTINRERAGVPSLIALPDDQSRSFQARQDLVRNGAAHSVMSRQGRLVHEKPAESKQRRDRVLDLRVDSSMIVAHFKTTEDGRRSPALASSVRSGFAALSRVARSP
jgi:hypothetical protein